MFPLINSQDIISANLTHGYYFQNDPEFKKIIKKFHFEANCIGDFVQVIVDVKNNRPNPIPEEWKKILQNIT